MGDVRVVSVAERLILGKRIEERCTAVSDVQRRAVSFTRKKAVGQKALYKDSAEDTRRLVRMGVDI